MLTPTFFVEGVLKSRSLGRFPDHIKRICKIRDLYQEFSVSELPEVSYPRQFTFKKDGSIKDMLTGTSHIRHYRLNEIRKYEEIFTLS